jgi:mycothiol synthase
MSLTITPVSREQQTVALQLLFARFPIDEQPSRLTDALLSVERGSLNLDGLILAKEGEQSVGVALVMHQTDGVTLVWPPVVARTSIDARQVEHALMTRATEEIDRAGSRLAQVLLAPDDINETELLERHGFAHAADMFFIARPFQVDDVKGTALDEDLDHQSFNASNADRYASVIERTYQGSLDCPFLNGFRTGVDALASHRLSGSFDPAGWRLYRIGNEDVGVFLMNEHPDQDAIELVYFGIVPEFRGQGLGRRVLADGLQAAALTGRAAMFLAVDCRNIYANALYSERGFAELARRRVMLRRSL